MQGLGEKVGEQALSPGKGTRGQSRQDKLINQCSRAKLMTEGERGDR